MLATLLALFLPLLTLQGAAYYAQYRTRREKEFEANREMAWAVSRSFQAFVADVVHQEHAIGLAILACPQWSHAQVHQYLQASATIYPAFSRINWLDHRGRALNSSDLRAVGIDYADRDYFQAIAGGRDWVISDLLMSRVGHRPAFVIAQGFRDARGRLTHVLVTTIEPSALDSMLALPRQTDGAIFILDRKGIMAYRYPSMRLTWEQRQWPMANPLVQQAMAGHSMTGMVTSRIDGEQRFVGLAPIPRYGWVAGASRPTRLAMAPVLRQLERDICLTLAIAVLASLVALHVSRRITEPVQQLNTQAKRIEQGQYDHIPIQIAGPREVEHLADAFNRMARALHAREQQLRTLSLTDPLTGLYNRRGLKILAQQLFNLADRQQEPIALIFLDLDAMKQINDTHGHQVGDAALQALTEALTLTFREADIIVRLAGDEFVVLAQGLREANWPEIEERLQGNLSYCSAAAQLPIPLTVSLGLAFREPGAPHTMDELLAHADAAMYADKRRQPADNTPTRTA